MASRKTPGSPKGDKIMRDALLLEIAEEVKVKGSKEPLRKARLLARKLVDNGLAGDTTAIKEVFDRVEGKAPQHIQAHIDVIDRIPFDDQQLIAGILEALARGHGGEAGADEPGVSGAALGGTKTAH